jgi:hypothetical protein
MFLRAHHIFQAFRVSKDEEYVPLGWFRRAFLGSDSKMEELRAMSELFRAFKAHVAGNFFFTSD